MSKYNHKTGSRGYHDGNVGTGNIGEGNVGAGTSAPAPTPQPKPAPTPTPAPAPTGEGNVGVGTFQVNYLISSFSRSLFREAAIFFTYPYPKGTSKCKVINRPLRF